jgi:hypothetical protein
VLRGRATGQYKHSPVLKEIARLHLGEAALTEPVR